ncbi:putative transposase [Rubripirellula obstinata]|uniref:Putative transposase n=1 Tax=Rubripirellula obstinata TaxID=406547 RepID=A0A5B1CLK7_9BACT|nr:Rpn family recombination-promoting nuclease/putative transposase [Rubripirellula obstinata]KAA1260659.1 putative transposase [Rubripirellula obstinata]
MDQLPTPHNNFFHFALSHLPSARSLIATQLDAEALKELKLETLKLETLKLETLKLETGSYVDSDLREKFSDLLFSVELAHPKNSESREANVYFLFEHKSQSDSTTVLQLLSYIIRIWEKRLRDGLGLCPIVPLVVYHGETGWTAARKLADLIDGPEALSAYQVNFEFPLLDLNRLSDQEIDGEPILRSSLRLLKYVAALNWFSICTTS